MPEIFDNQYYHLVVWATVPVAVPILEEEC